LQLNGTNEMRTNRRLMTIEEAFVELENYIDASDPDLDLVRYST